MKYVLIVFFVFLFAFTAHADKIAIAVLDLDAKGEGLNQSTAEALTETIRHEFAKTGPDDYLKEDSVDLVARDKMVQIAKEKAIQLSGITEVSNAVVIGKALNVKKLVTGSVVKVGDKYSIYLRIIDVQKENFECSERGDVGDDINNLEKTLRELIYKVTNCMWTQVLNEAVKLKPNDANAHFKLGSYLTRQMRFMEAEKELRAGIRLRPDLLDGFLNLGVLYAYMGRVGDVARVYRELIQEKGDSTQTPWLHYYLGLALCTYETMGLGDSLRVAENEFREAIRLKPDFGDGYFHLGFCLDSQGRRKEAREYYERAVKFKTLNINQAQDRLKEPD